MKDLVENRKKIDLGQKISLLRTVVRENGLPFTFFLGAYYVGSAVSEFSFGQMQRLREKKGLPGVNSAALNHQIWNSWDSSSGGEEWTPSTEWKDSLVENILREHIPTSGHILEIGPGAGRWTEFLVEMADTLTAVDISETCVALCRRKFASHPNAHFLLNTGSDLAGVVDSSIDALWSFDVFVHINRAEVERYASEFNRVLRPGAKAVVHHGKIGGERGGWRSNLTAGDFALYLEQSGLRVLDQFETWVDPHTGTKHEVGLYEDVVTVFEKPAG